METPSSHSFSLINLHTLYLSLFSPPVFWAHAHARSGGLAVGAKQMMNRPDPGPCSQQRELAVLAWPLITFKRRPNAIRQQVCDGEKTHASRGGQGLPRSAWVPWGRAVCRCHWLSLCLCGTLVSSVLLLYVKTESDVAHHSNVFITKDSFMRILKVKGNAAHLYMLDLFQYFAH